MHCCRSNAGGAAQKAWGFCVTVFRTLILLLRYRIALVAACCTIFCAAIELSGAERGKQHLQASTSDSARREAIQAVPLKNIHQRYRRSVQKVLIDSSLFRRMPTQMVDCDPEMFTFLMKNPEMLVEMWQQMGISRVALKRTGANTFSLADGAGTTGELVIVEQKCDGNAQNRIVMYADGAYDGKPFKRPVRAQCVLLLRSGSMRETNGRDYVACRLDSFVRIERTSLEIFAKALHPWVGKTADANFADTINFISNLSQAAEQKPASIERLVNSLPRVTEGRQQRMVRLAYSCSEKYEGEESVRVARKAN